MNPRPPFAAGLGSRCPRCGRGVPFGGFLRVGPFKGVLIALQYRRRHELDAR